MARPKITLKSKLSRVSSPKEATEDLNLLKKPKGWPRAYRWRPYDVELMEELVAKINAQGQYFKVDVTKLLRGALFLASKKKPEQLLEEIMTAERLSLASKKIK